MQKERSTNREHTGLLLYVYCVELSKYIFCCIFVVSVCFTFTTWNWIEQCKSICEFLWEKSAPWSLNSCSYFARMILFVYFLFFKHLTCRWHSGDCKAALLGVSIIVLKNGMTLAILSIFMQLTHLVYWDGYYML